MTDARDSPPDSRATVLALLAAAGLSPSDAELEMLVEQYPFMRAASDLMWLTPEIRYERPALVFKVDPEA
ncbi:hypothetical protein ACRU13_09300 [Mycobacterium colombiense]